MRTATIRVKGQVTIPKAVRDALGVRAGDQLVFVLDEDGARIRLVRRQRLSHLRGLLQGRAPFLGRAAERAAAYQLAAGNALEVPA